MIDQQKRQSTSRECDSVTVLQNHGDLCRRSATATRKGRECGVHALDDLDRVPMILTVLFQLDVHDTLLRYFRCSRLIRAVVR